MFKWKSDRHIATMKIGVWYSNEGEIIDDLHGKESGPDDDQSTASETISILEVDVNKSCLAACS